MDNAAASSPSGATTQAEAFLQAGLAGYRLT